MINVGLSSCSKYYRESWPNFAQILQIITVTVDQLRVGFVLDAPIFCVEEPLYLADISQPKVVRQFIFLASEFSLGYLEAADSLTWGQLRFLEPPLTQMGEISSNQVSKFQNES